MAPPKSPARRLAAKKTSTASKTPAPKASKVIPGEAAKKPKTDAASLNRGDLLERVKSSAGEINGQVTTAIMDIVLLELSQALRDGKAIKALPTGNLVIQKRKPLSDGEVLLYKLRIKNPKFEKPHSATRDNADESP